jgi:deoxyribonuclease IV
MRLGCHLSIAGGVHHALELAEHYRLKTVAMFVRNQRQWHAPPLGETETRLFRAMRKRLGIDPVVAHGSYLVNLAGEPDIRDKSEIAMADELDRCIRLGIDYLVIHPGSSGDEQAGVRRIAESLNGIVAARPRARTKILLESTAGQGNCLGCTFEQLDRMLRLLEPRGRFGVCLDTCHLFADGYDIRTPQAYSRTMDQFDRVVGLERLGAIHLNDSMKELGSHVDRHAHIGQGKIGLAGLANVVNDPRLADMPMILETPHGLSPSGQDYDEMNIARSRGFSVSGAIRTFGWRG